MKSLAMNKFIFKSANRLVKNSSLTLEDLLNKLLVIQTQLRLLRQDNQDMSLKLDKLLIDKHLQTQVDTYFEDNPENELEDK